MSPSTSRKEGLPRKGSDVGALQRRIVEVVEVVEDDDPVAAREAAVRQRWEPMKPAPPVTRSFKASGPAWALASAESPVLGDRSSGHASSSSGGTWRLPVLVAYASGCRTSGGSGRASAGAPTRRSRRRGGCAASKIAGSLISFPAVPWPSSSLRRDRVQALREIAEVPRELAAELLVVQERRQSALAGLQVLGDGGERSRRRSRGGRRAS